MGKTFICLNNSEISDEIILPVLEQAATVARVKKPKVRVAIFRSSIFFDMWGQGNSLHGRIGTVWLRNPASWRLKPINAACRWYALAVHEFTHVYQDRNHFRLSEKHAKIWQRWAYWKTGERLPKSVRRLAVAIAQQRRREKKQGISIIPKRLPRIRMCFFEEPAV